MKRMTGTKTLILLILLSLSLNGFTQNWPASLVGRWTFDDLSNLTKASIGNDLVLTGTHSVTPGIGPGDGAVAIDIGSYYTCNHGIQANGGGNFVNEYSLMFDFKVDNVTEYHSIFQTGINNTNDGDAFLNPTGNIGIGVTGYSGLSVPINTWHRLMISIDLGNFYKYYLDGHLILSGISQPVDGRFALDLSSVLFFADEDGEDNLIYVSQIAIFNTALTASEVLETGGLVSSNIKPYLQTPTPASIYISWNSYDAGESIVQYGTNSDLQNSQTGTYEDISTNRWHTVKLTGLTPDTRYYYRCISGTDTSAIYPFHTPALPGTPGHHTRFAIISDSQDDVVQSNLTADSLLATFNRLYGQNWPDSVSLVIHTGDITQDGSSPGRYMNEYFNSFSRLTCSVPFMISIGNHELESSYFYSFMKYEDFSDFPVGNNLNEKYYSLYLGDCQFIMMNSNGPYNNATQTGWLHDRLAESSTNELCDFVFELNHHPGHSEIWPDGNVDFVQTDIYNELAKFPKVTLSSHGHSHNYERGTVESNAAEKQDFRITIAGGAGGPLDRWGYYANQTNYPEVQHSLDHYCYLILDTDRDSRSCDASMYSLGNPDFQVNNSIMDSWHKRVNQAAPEKPVALSPVSTSGNSPILTASAFIGDDSLMSSRFQLIPASGNFNSPLIDVKRDNDDTYGVQPAPSYLPINLNAGINISELQVPAGILTYDSVYQWRVCYRDQNVKWSEWSDPVNFKVTSVNANFADFKADVTKGNAPLTVHFTDLSLANPTAWDWDMDGDHQIDSHLQNPVFTYNASGNYNVSLTTHFGDDTATVVKASFIQVTALGIIPATKKYQLQCTPDPFISSVKISFTIEQHSPIRLEIIDMDGTLIRTIAREESKAGDNLYNWDGCDENHQPVPPGTYICRLIGIDAIDSVLIIRK